jgi:small subunit ribosomal protein S4
VKLFLKGERCLSPKCAIERRNQPPGPPPKSRRRKISDRGMQLREKQKARYVYGVLERQFHAYFEEAARLPGVTGENLVRILEARLDNVVYRLGFADSRDQGRQLVNHGHITLNGRKTDIASALTKVGDSVGWTPQGAKTEYAGVLREEIARAAPPSWLSLDKDSLSGRVIAVPARSEAEQTFDESVIVEYYSR